MTNVTAGSTLLNTLRDKYKKKEFYTYISEMLLAVNPNETIDEFCTAQLVKQYEGKSLGELPPHPFGIGDNVLKNLRIYGMPQSIIISGVTGSGKSENMKILLKFFSDSSITSTSFAGILPDANILLEAFGNSSTAGNLNSSRFIKVIQINYGCNCKIVGSKLETYLFEYNRVCVGSYANFHMFYYLRYGAPENLKTQLSLEHSFSCLPENINNFATQNVAKDFTRVDEILDRITGNQKHTIYRFLAAILHVGNIQFENDGPDDRTCIVETTEHHIETAADLLDLAAHELKSHLLCYFIRVGDDKITCHSNSFVARKTRDTLVKCIYKHLIKFIISSINGVLVCDSKIALEYNKHINLLDIAGFEYFDPTMNQFEQFCINYANEKIQNFCTQRLIYKEQEWYKAEGLDLPEISFPGNEKVLNLLEDKGFGIFEILDDECKMRKPNLENFMYAVVSKHKNSNVFSTKPSNRAKTKEVSFTICHFACDVQYSTENFIEKNTEKYSESLLSLLSHTFKSLCSKNQDKFIGSVKTSSSKVMKSTVSSKFRLDLNMLLSRLNATKCHFIQCIKANTEQAPRIFEKDFISGQLESSGVIAYYQLMQFGFPSTVQISTLFEEMISYLEPRHISLGKNVCCRILFLAIGFTSKEFKIGKTEVFIRPGKTQLLDKLHADMKYSKAELKLKFHTSFCTFMRKVLSIRFRFLGKMLIAKQQKEQRIRNQPIQSDASCSETTTDTFDEKTVEEEKEKNLPEMLSTNKNLETTADALSQRIRVIDISKQQKRKRSPSKTPKEKLPLNALRFNGLQHNIEYDDPNGPRKAHRCKREGCGLPTTVYCETCNVHLCFVTGKNGRNCFKRFHNLNES